MKRILALDQSTTNTGFSIYEDDKLVKSGVFTPKSNTRDYFDRTIKTRDWLINIIKENEFDVVGIEDIQVQGQGGRDALANVAVFKKLAHLQGVIMAALIDNKQSYEVIAPSVWKSTCNTCHGKRANQKKETLNFVLKEYGIAATEDEADAIGIGFHMTHKEETEINW